MGKKSASKGQPASRAAQPPGTKPPSEKKGLNPLVIGTVLLAAVGVGVFAFWGGSDSPALDASTAAASAPAEAGADAGALAKAEAQARLGPRKQASYPPIPFAAYAPPRPNNVVTDAYHFAAEHPEILSYVPCFCGCERSGHGANHDCFIKSRNAEGDVVEWDEHGVECAVCIDVANRSRQMHASGASVRDIRAAIDREFGSRVPTQMHTPHPPARRPAADDEHGGH